MCLSHRLYEQMLDMNPELDPDRILSSQAEKVQLRIRTIREENRSLRKSLNETTAKYDRLKARKEKSLNEAKLKYEELATEFDRMKARNEHLENIFKNINSSFDSPCESAGDLNSKNSHPNSPCGSATDSVPSPISNVNLKNDDRAVYHKVDTFSQTDVIVAECSCLQEKRNERQITKVDSCSQTDIANVAEISFVQEQNNEQQVTKEKIDPCSQTNFINVAQYACVQEQSNDQLITLQFVESTERGTGPNGISNYFSTFSVDPHSTTGDENMATVTAGSNIPPMLKMVLQSYDSFDKRYLCFFANDCFGRPDCCEFVSIDELLASPQNEDLKKQLDESYDPHNQDNHNRALLTVLGELIARSYFTPKVCDVNETTEFLVQNEHLANNQNQIQAPDERQPEVPAVQKKKRPLGKKSKLPKEETPLVDEHPPSNKKTPPVGKKPSQITRRPSYVYVPRDDDESEYIVSDDPSTETIVTTESEYEPPNKKTKSHTNTKCKICKDLDSVNRYFNTYRALDLHLINKHAFTSFPTYQRCPHDGGKCTRHYSQKKHLMRHIKLKHSNATSTPLPKKWISEIESKKCTYCGETFLSSRIYKKHVSECDLIKAETYTRNQIIEIFGGITENETEPEASKLPIAEKKKKTGSSKKRGRSVKKRKSSVSSSDEDFNPDAVSVPSQVDKSAYQRPAPKSRKKSIGLKKENAKNVVVTTVDVNQTQTLTTAETKEHFEPADSTNVTKKAPESAKSSASMDINEFVLNSLDEISSMITKQNEAAAAQLPSLSTETPLSNYQYNSAITQPKSSFPSHLLPCLLDNCTGCDYHRNPTFNSLTLDDEYVSRCREDILAELYSIPDDPPMVHGSYGTSLSSYSEYDSIPTDTCSDVEGAEVEYNANAASSNRTNDNDAGDVVIANNINDRVTNDADTRKVSTKDDNTTTSTSAQKDADRSSKMENNSTNANDDEILANKEPSDNIDPLSVNEDHLKTSETDPIKTSVLEQNKIANVDDQNKSDDNRVVEQVSTMNVDNSEPNKHCLNDIELSIHDDDAVSPIYTSPVKASQPDVCESSVIEKENENATVDDQCNADENRTYKVISSPVEPVVPMEVDSTKSNENCSNMELSPGDNDVSASSVNKSHSDECENAKIEKQNESATVDDKCNADENRTYNVTSSPVEPVVPMEVDSTKSNENCSNMELSPGDNDVSASSVYKSHSDECENAKIEKRNESATVDDKCNADENQTYNATSSPVEPVVPMEVDSSKSNENCSNMELSPRDNDVSAINASSINKSHSDECESAEMEKQNESATVDDQCNQDDNQTHDMPSSSVEPVPPMEVDSAKPDEHGSNSSNIEVVNDFSANQRVLNAIETSPINEGHSDTCKSVSPKQNIIAEVDDKKDPVDDQAYDAPLSSVHPVSPMEVDNSKTSEHCSSSSNVAECENTICAPITTQNEYKISQSCNNIPIQDNPIVPNVEEISNANQNRLETTNSGSIKTAPSAPENRSQKKSIFDPEDGSNPATPQQTHVRNDSDFSADDEVSKTRVNASQSPVPDSSTVCESTPTQSSSSTETNNANVDEISSTQAPPESPKHIITFNEPGSTANVPSSNHETSETNLEETTPNSSTAKGNATFYDEFDLENVCEIETCHQKESRTSTPGAECNEITPPTIKSGQTIVDTPLLKKLLAQVVTSKSTNEIIDGVGIEIEISESVSPQTLVQDLKSAAIQSSTPLEVNKTSDTDSKKKVIKKKSKQRNVDSSTQSSFVRKKLKWSYRSENANRQSYSVGNENANKQSYSVGNENDNKQSYSVGNENAKFKSLVKQMLTETSLGVVKTTDKANSSSDSASSSSSSSSCSCTSCSSDSSNDREQENHPPRAKHSHSSQTRTDTSNEKEGYENNAVPVDETPPVELAVPSQSIRMSPNNTNPGQKDPNQCSVINTTSTSSQLDQPDQSHNAVEINPQRAENTEEDSLITSSGQRVESDSPSNGSTPNNTSGKSDFELISMLMCKRDLNLVNMKVIIPRLQIDSSKSISSEYHLKKQKRLSYPFLNSMKLKRVFPCNICQSIFLSSQSVSKHLNSMHKGAEGTINCSICGFIAYTKASLASHRKHRHMLLSTEFTQCLVCNHNNQGSTVYDSNEALNAHIMAEHPDPSPFYIRCPHNEGECFWHSSTILELKEHLELFHKPNALMMQWQCSLCEQIFSQDELLSEHILKEHDVPGVHPSPYQD